MRTKRLSMAAANFAIRSAILAWMLTLSVANAQPATEAVVPSRQEPEFPPAGVIVAARVNDASICVAEVHRYLNRLPFINDSNRSTYASWGLQALIDRQRVLEYLQQRTSFLAPGEVENAIEKRRQALGRRGQLLETVLSDAGVDEAALSRSLTWNLIWRRYLAKHLSLARQQNYFREHAAHFDGRQVEVAQILWQWDASVTPQQQAQVIEEAKRVLLKIRDGSLSFAEAARQYSDGPSAAEGGQLGFIDRNGPMPESFSQAAFELAAGETSEPVLDHFGVHLIHALSVRPGKRKFADVQFEVERAARKELFQALVKRAGTNSKVEYTGVIPPFHQDNTPPLIQAKLVTLDEAAVDEPGPENGSEN